MIARLASKLLRATMPTIEARNFSLGDRLLNATYRKARVGRVVKVRASNRKNAYHSAHHLHRLKRVRETYPAILDQSTVEAGEANPLREKFDKPLYPPYLKTEDLVEGIKDGVYKHGRFKVSPGNFLEGYVVFGSGETDQWFVKGLANMNRATEGDCVVVELLPKGEWSYPEHAIRLRDQDEVQPATDHKDDGAAGESTDASSDSGDASEGANDTASDQSPPAKKTKKSAEMSIPSAKIIGVLERNWRDYCGVILPARMRGTMRLFAPTERAIPRVLVDTRYARELVGKKMIVRIYDWPVYSKFPLGHHVRPIGDAGDRETENRVILLENGIDYGNQFSDAVQACLPSPSWTPAPCDKRKDFTHLDIFSIDPEGCTDIDDALHCTQLGKGRYEVGVHIADVSHFVRPGTPLDKEASHRGTTVYLCSNRYEMLPELLSSNLCSLREGEPRYAFSVTWTMDEEARVQSTKFTKSTIRSRAALTYAKAQEIIDDASIQGHSVTTSLRHLMRLSRKLKERRKERGALELASTEISFEMDALTAKPKEVIDKSHLETMSLVEEFMLLANVTVAKKIVKAYPDCAILRRHPPPTKKMFEPLMELAKSCSFPLKVDSGKDLAASLDAIEVKCRAESTEATNKTLVGRMFRMLTTRCMTMALYFPAFMKQRDQFYHYGLASHIYTHFTSPIRRYADIMVHRLLASALQVDDLHPFMLNRKLLRQVTDNLNIRNSNAKRAARDSVFMNTVLLLKDKPEECIDAIVIDISTNGFRVMVPKYALESVIILPEDVVKAETTGEMANYLKQHGIRLFKFVKVGLSATLVNNSRRINITLVEPKLDKYVPLAVGCELDLPE